MTGGEFEHRADVDAGDGDTIAGVPLEEVLEQVRQGFYLVAKESGSDLVPLKGVELTLNTVLEWTAKFGPKFKIPFVDIEVDLSHTSTRSQVHTVTIKLKRPSAGLDERWTAPSDLPTTLADGLRTIRDAVKAAAAGDPPLELDEGSLKLQFGVGHDDTAKLIVFEAGRKSAWTHTLTVLVGEPEAAG